MALHMEQSQKQVLSQKMIQSVTILQMSAQELTDYIKEETLSNPVVELEYSVPENKEQERIKKLEWLAGLDEQNRSFYRYDKEDAEENDGIDNLTKRTGEKLEEVLHFQLIGKGYTEREMQIFDYIAGCLDSKGYYTASAPELGAQLNITEKEAEKYLDIMRDLEPAGVCAANLKECLLKQLEKSGKACENEKRIVSEYMELLGKNQLHVIARKLKIPMAEVIEAVREIKNLNPRPAQGFDNGEMLRYVVPDITVVKFQEQFEILINDYSCPVLHISQEYLNMKKSDCGDDVKEYLLKQVRRVEGLQECISRRNATLLSLAKCIIDAQAAFFLHGEKRLKPFRLQEAAEIMGVHESTVSRAVRDKYLQCCWGIFPLSHFFPKGMSQPMEADDLAVSEIKQQIREIIDGENKSKPYSDQKIAEIMEEQKTVISRRTVAKYRESMNIPNCRGRKVFE